MKITVTNRQRRVRPDLAWLRALAERAIPFILEHPGPRSGALSGLEGVEITLLGDGSIARVNEQFLQHVGPTDVITFDHGEILVGAGIAQQNAERYGKPLNHEVALYMVHGLLHLHGWSDKAPAEAARMALVQETILAKLIELS